MRMKTLRVRIVPTIAVACLKSIRSLRLVSTRTQLAQGDAIDQIHKMTAHGSYPMRRHILYFTLNCFQG
ncbi:hypothetical protein [Paenibacillus sp. GCM10028914]|uniref:hypothetical protein n=1 Tax=Paenibacillus sp. GCM10028914 TaxID=3273416 RepID=UPI00361B8392